MRTAAAVPVQHKNTQPSFSAPTAGQGTQRLPGNALTHGLRSGHVLLPGDDVPAFRTLRHRLFHAHQPRTIAEALHVETLAANEWRIARCRLEQRFFKLQLGAAMGGHPDAAGGLCSPDLHRIHHRSTDCNREERRLERSNTDARAALTRLQTGRTEHLTPAIAAVLEPYEVFLAEGEPVVAETSGAEAPPSPPKDPATASDDVANGIGSERESGPPHSPPPPRWNRRARRQAARSAGGAGRPAPLAPGGMPVPPRQLAGKGRAG